MEIHYCEHFDGEVFAPGAAVQVGHLYAGDARLLAYLEAQLGLSVEQENTNYLRIEFYRQALLEVLTTTKDGRPFYGASFETDPWAVAETLLAWRDELLLYGWDFTTDESCPPRLADLARVEPLFQAKVKALAFDGRILGVADRWARVLAWLRVRPVALKHFWAYEPKHLWLPHIKRLTGLLSQWGVPVQVCLTTQPMAVEGTDLAHWQAYLCGLSTSTRPAVADGSVRLFRMRRDSDGALFLAGWLAQTGNFRPLLLLPSGGNLLEQALLQQGLPALGVPSASLARPSLQTLKLAAAFLWEPVDVFKIMEFLTLPLKPFDDGLALEIARVLAEKPGLFSDTWFAVVSDYLERPTIPPSARQHYDFWFSRKRYRADGTAPTAETAEIYDYLYRWALERVRHSPQSSLAALAEQARRVRDVLLIQPNTHISRLELERIVRTVHEPAPLALHPTQVGALPFVQHPGAIATPVEAICWWNCANDLFLLQPDRWRTDERQWLAKRQVVLPNVEIKAHRHLFFLQQAILRASRQIILFLPEQICGQEAQKSLIISSLETIFERAEALFVTLDAETEKGRVEEAAVREQIVSKALPRLGARTHLKIPQPERLGELACQTPTELEQFLYFPHRWFFRHKTHLYPSSLLSIARDQLLLGKLAHRFFEFLLREPDCLQWKKPEVFQWISQRAPSLLAKEGATLLLYGREPERQYLLSRVQTAAWSLIETLRADGWTIYGTEIPLEGLFCNFPLHGRADLVLQRSDDEWAIVDLKWSGLSKRIDQIRNGEDLQLLLYSYLLPPVERWAHTAYFIIEEARMLARNRRAFQRATVPFNSEENHADAYRCILDRMEKTYHWRREQLREGLIELRYEQNAGALNDFYGAEALEMLEMKTVEYRDEYYALVWGGD